MLPHPARQRRKPSTDPRRDGVTLLMLIRTRLPGGIR
jgi:hypothetical protein